MREQIAMNQKVFSIAPSGHAAVHDDLSPGDEARLVRGEEQRRVRGVAPIAREAQRNALQSGSQKRFHVAAGALLCQPRLDHRRMQLPGDTVFTRMPFEAYCTATTRESWITAALVAAYATCAEPVQRKPEVEARLMITPPAWRSITGRTCLQARNTLFRLWSTCASQSSSLISTGPPGAEPPTLLTRMSMRPHSLRQDCTIALTETPSVTSQICILTAAFCTVSRRLAASRSTAKTFAPSSAKRTAVARPLPQPGPTEPAPVMIATRP